MWANAPPVFFYLSIFDLVTNLKRGQMKKERKIG